MRKECCLKKNRAARGSKLNKCDDKILLFARSEYPIKFHLWWHKNWFPQNLLKKCTFFYRHFKWLFFIVILNGDWKITLKKSLTVHSLLNGIPFLEELLKKLSEISILSNFHFWAKSLVSPPRISIFRKRFVGNNLKRIWKQFVVILNFKVVIFMFQI